MHRFNESFGQYIMDKLDNFVTLEEYTQHGCPSPEFYNKLRQAIEDFWRITGGYHGDLHSSNIGIHNGKIKIIDYGSHKKFKTRINENTCFDDFIRIIDQQYNIKYAKTKLKNFYPRESKIRILYPKKGQPLRANTNMLRYMNIYGKPTNNFSKSIMSKINPKNVKVNTSFLNSLYLKKKSIPIWTIKSKVNNLSL